MVGMFKHWTLVNSSGMYVTVQISDGLGNRFFQVAAMLGYAERTGHVPAFVRNWIKDNSHPGPNIITDYFPDIPIIEETSDWGKLTAKDAFIYRALPPCLKNNVCLNGYFQALGYLPKQKIARPAILEGPCRTNQAFLHVRRGDYLDPYHAHHCVPLSDYYRKALQLYEEDVRILVCSDDIPWCKEMLVRQNCDIVAPHRWIFLDADDVTTLAAMTACEYGGICANSTFSWWGAYWNISPQKLICMPRMWGQPPMPEAKELYPEDVVVI